ncbi:peptidylprolyl isomerase [Okeania sp. KiyG1]|uniref:peptidylprolyl isomerase n=1 Tax=Okeania sp. KiyG1 TaxID=2720165 RepID=UPI00192221FC|nr:peptidylprolyl isomerase [Okeania sp. KiyG1]GFZ99863.1 peptidyl-prolyl cis-trans isomerase [Okeania sp. KiyG1]
MQRKISQLLLSLIIVVTLLVTGCTATSVPSTEVSTLSSQTTLDAKYNSLPQLNGKATVVMTVNSSPITIEVDGTNAPVTAGNFIDLVEKGVYDGLVFHRVVREPQPFVVQGGDPQSKNLNIPLSNLGTGGFIDPTTSRERYIPLEIKPQDASEPVYSNTLEEAGIAQPPVLPHTRGAVAMARSQFPDSASSQFYFTLTDLPFLNGNYAVFGYVTQGMKEVVDNIEAGDRIESAKVVEGLENLTIPNSSES